MRRHIEEEPSFVVSSDSTAPYLLSSFLAPNAVLGMNGIDYVVKTYQRWFQQGKEPATEPNLTEILQELNLDHQETIQKANDNKIKDQYLKNTESAYEKGVFGSPSFIFEGEVFWGDDRLEDCIKWIRLKQM